MAQLPDVEWDDPSSHEFFVVEQIHQYVADQLEIEQQSVTDDGVSLVADLSGVLRSDAEAIADAMEETEAELSFCGPAQGEPRLETVLSELGTVMEIEIGAADSNVVGVYERPVDGGAGDWSEVDVLSVYEVYKDELGAVTDADFDKYVAMWEDGRREEVYQAVTESFLERLQAELESVRAKTGQDLEHEYGWVVYREVAEQHVDDLMAAVEEGRRRETPVNRVERVLQAELSVDPRTASAVASDLEAKDLLVDAETAAEEAE